MTDRTGDPLLRPGEVCALFSITLCTLARWADTGRLASIRTVGGHRRFRTSEVQRFAAGRRAR